MGNLIVAGISGLLVGIIFGIPWGYAISQTTPEEWEDFKQDE